MPAHSIEITGVNLLGGQEVRGGTAVFRSADPRTGREGDVAFVEATPQELTAAATLAARAFEGWPSSDRRTRAALLRAAADQLVAWRESIIAIADQETALGPERLSGELDRTTGQLRAFADLVDEGSYVQAILSPADVRATPPRPDVRRMLLPIGPVAVFTPSNFPLAFGVAGGDTASALAVGCPVIVKGHPSHPGTSEICARAILAAAASTRAPAGVLSLVQARDVAIARAVVTAPEIQAVAFTGSLAAGRALHDLAATRPTPIPVYAEMGSVNPLFIGSGALRTRAPEIADGLAASITQGTGQFCTKPGLVFLFDDENGSRFTLMLAERLAGRAPGVMLSRSIRDTLERQVSRTIALPGVLRVSPVSTEHHPTVAPIVAATDAATFLKTAALREEHFGPFALLVRCASATQMIEAARCLQGNLTATIHADPSDHRWAGELAGVLSGKVGRVIWNGYPTGVAVTWAMQHGGPYPASTAAAHTSVGATAVARFLRPVAFQNAPDELLPEALRDANPLGIQRLIDGRWTRDSVRR